MSRCKQIIPGLWREKQEDQEFQVQVQQCHEFEMFFKINTIPNSPPLPKCMLMLGLVV